MPFSPSYSAAHSKRDLHIAPAAPCRQAACCAAPLALSLCHSQLRFSSLSAYVCCASLSVPVLLSHSCLLLASLNLLSPQCLPAYSWQQQIVFRHFVLFRTFAVSNTWQQHKRASERVSARATDNCESTDWESATALPLQKRTHLSVCERERERNRVRVSRSLAFCTQHSCSVVVVINADAAAASGVLLVVLR